MMLVWLAVGLGLLLGGGAALVRGASGLAARLGVSPMAIGLTVVAFGTSAPELTVNVLAAVGNQPDIAFGNVVGSNLANLGLVLGVAALIQPLRIRGRLIIREFPFLMLVSAVALVLALDPLLRGEPAAYDRADGIVPLLFFAIFLYIAVRDVVRDRLTDPLLAEAAHREALSRHPTLRGAGVLVGMGLVGLLVGGEVTVHATIEVARAVGLPEGVVALLLLAVGTSLPELVTSVIAVRQGETDMAVANVIGSNAFNLLFALPATVLVRPFALEPGASVDLVAALALSAIVLWMAVTHERRIVRWEGLLLVALWAAYGVLRVVFPG
jgi:cation:H+ antiporter